MRRSLLVSALVLALAGCQSAPAPRVAPEAAPQPAAAPAVESPAAHDNLNALAWMQAAEEYRLATGQTYRAALAQLDRAIKTPDWDALVPSERANPPDGLPPAVIFDIDETVLDNSPYQARLLRDGGFYEETTWDAWVREEKAQPIPGALEFARAAAARGVTLFYVSNRAVHLDEPTLANLRAVGFPVDDNTRFLGLGHFVEGCEQIGTEKGCRRQLIGRTHRVLMQFGDQIGDMVTIEANNPAGRQAALEPYLGWFGERWWVLPNPTYGSWEPALFNNAWSLPEVERRRMKYDALDYAE